MNTIAERYVKLVLAVGQHDADYVDAYYGQPSGRPRPSAQKLPLRDDRAPQPSDLIADIPPLSEADRRDESRAAARLSEAAARGAARARADAAGREADVRRGIAGALRRRRADASRVVFRRDSEGAGSRCCPATRRWSIATTHSASRFIIPPDRLARVFDRAIAECRARTLAHVQLPPNESFTVEYVTDKPWSGYNWYQGDFRSLIQVNTDLPIYIDRAIDLACHEGYPGHHVYNALLEKHLVRDRGWIEFTVYPLFSPQSLIAEGTANYGIEVAFPGDERAAFERDVLYPAGGARSVAGRGLRERAGAGRSARVCGQRGRAPISERRDPIGKQATAWLSQYAMMSPVRAEQRTRFFDTYRSYVINYNLGKDLVKQYVESRGGVAASRRSAGRSSCGCSRRRGCRRRCADGVTASRSPERRTARARSARSTSTSSISCCAAASIAARACSMPAAATAAI